MGIKMKIIRFTVMLCTVFFISRMSYAANSVEGIVKAIHEVDLAFQLDGVIAKTVVSEGAKIRTGDVLIKLDDSLQKLEVSRREAILNDRAEIDSNKKNLAILKELLTSSQELYQKLSAISRDEVMNIEMQYHTLAGRIEVAEARKIQERIEYSIAKEMLERYTLVSPINGVVTSIKHEAGEWAKNGETIITAADTSVCYAEFNIEEKYARNMRAGRQTPLRVREGDSLTHKTGKITYVAPVADKASALVRVKVEFENRNGKIVPGVLAYMDLH